MPTWGVREPQQPAGAKQSTVAGTERTAKQLTKQLPPDYVKRQANLARLKPIPKGSKVAYQSLPGDPPFSKKIFNDGTIFEVVSTSQRSATLPWKKHESSSDEEQDSDASETDSEGGEGILLRLGTVRHPQHVFFPDINGLGLFSHNADVTSDDFRKKYGRDIQWENFRPATTEAASHIRSLARISDCYTSIINDCFIIVGGGI